MPPIWILEESLDGGKTWRVSSPWQVWKKKETADRKLETMKGWRWLYRITEYRAVEDK
jgi:hypothetical protein